MASIENLIYARHRRRRLVVALPLAVRRVDTAEAGGEGLLHEFGRSVPLVRRRINQLGHEDGRAVRRRFKEEPCPDAAGAAARCRTNDGVDGVRKKQEC